MDQRIKLQMLRVVDAIETQGSILKAASALHISQPGLTKSLQELEDIVGAKLFERHSRGVRVTEAGVRLIASGRKILAELSRLDEDLDDLSDPQKATIALGALPVAAAGVLPGVLARLKILHQGLRIRLHQGRMEELLPLLAAGEIDLVVGRLYEPAFPDGLYREPLWSEPISILARQGHPIFLSPSDVIGRLRDCEIILPTITQRVGREIDEFLGSLGLTPDSPWRANSQAFIREMLCGSDMVAVMPRLMMVGDLIRGTLRIVPLPVTAPERPAGLLLSPRRPLSPAGRILADSLRSYVKEVEAQSFLPIIASYNGANTNDKTSPPLSV